MNSSPATRLDELPLPKLSLTHVDPSPQLIRGLEDGLALFHFEQPGIVTRALSWPGLTRRIYLLRRRDRSLSLAAQSLHALVSRHKPRPPAASPARVPGQSAHAETPDAKHQRAA